MTRGNGVVYCCHPLFALFIRDYPEQCLAACTKSGQCPKGTTPHDNLGDYLSDQNPCPLHDINDVLGALDHWPFDSQKFYESCKAAGIKPITDLF
jgi:hypothetical protein